MSDYDKLLDFLKEISDYDPSLVFLKGPEVAKILRLSDSKAYALMQAREIPVVPIGGSVRVRLSDLRSYTEGRVERDGQEKETPVQQRHVLETPEWQVSGAVSGKSKADIISHFGKRTGGEGVVGGNRTGDQAGI